jgi:hypothetical protein
MITPEQLSRYRQTIRKLSDKIEHLASRCLFADPLIHGTPAEVFRKCGRPNCKCADNLEDRHGPYKVIQVIREGKSRQICLRREQENLWELAKRYQFQTEKLAELKGACQELQQTITEVIEKRVREFP